MGSFPWLPLMAIMGSLVTLAAVNYSLKSYAGFMVANLGVVDSKNEAGEQKRGWLVSNDQKSGWRVHECALKPS